MDSYKYYDLHYEQFLNSIKDAHMNDQINRFIKYIKPSCYILDAGCGSGRDSLTFIKLGYKVLSFDASVKMCEIAEQNTKQQVLNLKFEDLNFKDKFDAIWANASLLHVNHKYMNDVFKRLYNALKNDGIMYCSFKCRDADYEKDGRYFTCFNQNNFIEFIKDTKFEIIEMNVSYDSRPERNNEKWLNIILKKGL